MSKKKKLSKKKTENVTKKVSTEEDKKVFVKDLKKEEKSMKAKSKEPKLEKKAEEKVKEIEVRKSPRASYYRNYPNKKLIRVLNRRTRKFRALSFKYRDIDAEEIEKRLVETEINKSKFVRGSEHVGVSNKEDIYFDKAFLPSAYFVDEAVLMPKNPTTLYVYWEIREETFNRLAQNNHVIDNIIIKLFKDGYEYRKIVRHERIGSHYILNVDTSKDYEVFIGYEDAYGNFAEVAHSEKVIAPSDKLSNNFDLLWGTVKEDKNTNQVIKYINTPTLSDENKEFYELSEQMDKFGKKLSESDYEEFTIEVLRRLRKIGASESILEIETDKVRTKPDRLLMTGVRSS
ncbi:DUF4912 domain-containing protein [Leptotrichia sp.]